MYIIILSCQNGVVLHFGLYYVSLLVLLVFWFNLGVCLRKTEELSTEQTSLTMSEASKVESGHLTKVKFIPVSRAWWEFNSLKQEEADEKKINVHSMFRSKHKAILRIYMYCNLKKITTTHSKDTNL